MGWRKSEFSCGGNFYGNCWLRMTEKVWLRCRRLGTGTKTRMKSDKLELKFWGVRGSIPVSGPEFERYGGNTSCIQIRCGEHRMIFDAGSGVREAGLAMLNDEVRDVDLFFSHCHYDHIIGLPFFKAIYYPS